MGILQGMLEKVAASRSEARLRAQSPEAALNNRATQVMDWQDRVGREEARRASIRASWKNPITVNYVPGPGGEAFQTGTRVMAPYKQAPVGLAEGQPSVQESSTLGKIFKAREDLARNTSTPPTPAKTPAATNAVKTAPASAPKPVTQPAAVAPAPAPQQAAAPAPKPRATVRARPRSRPAVQAENLPLPASVANRPSLRDAVAQKDPTQQVVRPNQQVVQRPMTSAMNSGVVGDLTHLTGNKPQTISPYGQVQYGTGNGQYLTGQAMGSSRMNAGRVNPMGGIPTTAVSRPPIVNMPQTRSALGVQGLQAPQMGALQQFGARLNAAPPAPVASSAGPLAQGVRKVVTRGRA
jgi:hypothetical protein